MNLPPVGVSPCNATQNFQELSCSNGQSHGVRWECALLRRLQTEMADENHLGPDLKCTKLLTKQDVEVSDGPNDAIAGPAGSHAKCTQKLSAACRSFVEKPAAFLSLVPDFCQTPWAALGIRLVSMRMDLP